MRQAHQWALTHPTNGGEASTTKQAGSAAANASAVAPNNTFFDLALHKKVYNFAYSAAGMNMLGTNAQHWADNKFQCLQ
jgi:hypothetical protein